MASFKCDHCGKEGQRCPSWLSRSKKNFCNVQCRTDYNRGLNRHLSDDVKAKISKSRKKAYERTGNKDAIRAARLGAKKRWEGHIKVEKKYKYKNKPYKERYTTEELLARKRFRNQRYKARKRNARGSHTFGEWELLRKQYGFACPMCRKQEPEIKLTEDHIIPLIKGGSDYIENIQPLCMRCNTKKHTKIIVFEPPERK